MVDELPGNLTGRYRVRAGSWAWGEAKKLLPRRTDWVELRRHALKLRFWPEPQPEDMAGQLLDLDWQWIKCLPGKRIGELRIHDTIGGCDNLRVIFFVPNLKMALPTLWVLSVIQKKRMDFSAAQLANFRIRRGLVLERFCHNPLTP